MDSKLYKILKQLRKLGILTNNTKVVRRRRRRRNVGNNNSQQYTNTHVRPTTVISTPTVQSEQAIVNLKASELQLQNALQNKDLPDDSKKKVQLAIEDIKAQLDQTNRTVNVNYNYLGDKIKDAKYYTVDEPDDEPVQVHDVGYDTDKEYHKMVPQTKNPMSPIMGIQGSTPHIPQSTEEWVNYSDVHSDKDNVEEHDNPLRSNTLKEDTAPPSNFSFIDADEKEIKTVKRTVGIQDQEKEPEKEPEKEDPKPVEPVIEQNEKKISSTAKSREKKKKLIAQYGELAAELEMVNKEDKPASWDMKNLQTEVDKLKIIKLQKRYRELGGDGRYFLSKHYRDINTLEKEVDKLVANLNKKG